MKGCPFPNCNRKYKRDEKLVLHVEKEHPLSTLRKHPNVKLGGKEIRKLASNLEFYMKLLLSDPTQTGETFNQCSATLNLTPENHAVFRSRSLDSGMLTKIWYGSTEQFNLVVLEFQKFFQMGVPWRGDNFCPSLIIDLVWHASMLDAAFYKDLCERYFGRGFILPHCLNHDDQTDAERFAQFERHFEHQYRRPYLKIENLGAEAQNGVETSVFDKLRSERVAKKEAKRLAAIEAKRIWDLNAPQRKIDEERRAAEERAHYARYGRSIGDDGKC